MGGLICTLLLLPVLRLRGIYFSMVTLIIPLVLVRIIEATKIFGGTEGLSGMTPLPSKWVELYLIMAVLLAVLFGFRRMMDSDYGLVLKGINDNDRSVINAGINIYWFKAQSLFIAGTIGCVLRRVHDPCVHVRRHAGLCPGLFHPAHCGGGCGRPGNLGRRRRSAPSSWFPCPRPCGDSADCESSCTASFWWSSSWPFPKGFSITSRENTTSSNAGWRWKNDRMHRFSRWPV